MAYIAKHYVKIAGRVFTPGEIIDGADAENLRAADAERLLTMGAILPCEEEEDAAQEAEAAEDEAADEPETVTEADDELPELDAEEAFVVAEEKPASPKRKGKKK